VDVQDGSWISQYANILRPEQDIAWPADGHVACILLDPAFFWWKEKLINLERKKEKTNSRMITNSS